MGSGTLVAIAANPLLPAVLPIGVAALKGVSDTAAINEIV